MTWTKEQVNYMKDVLTWNTRETLKRLLPSAADENYINKIENTISGYRKLCNELENLIAED